MIASLTGKIKFKDALGVVLDVSGVGYRIFLPTSILSRVGEVGSAAEFLIHTHVREDILALYGFLTADELGMFELLLTISGVGPKAAMSILSAASVSDLRSAISSGSTEILTKVSGIGKKTAERVVVELRGKLGKELGSLGRLGSLGEVGTAETEAFDALCGLGYQPGEVREVLKMLGEAKTAEEKIKLGLQRLARG